MAKGYTYILECSDGNYYTGSTKDLENRLQQHQNGEGANHTKKRLPVKLVYVEESLELTRPFIGKNKYRDGTEKRKKS